MKKIAVLHTGGTIAMKKSEGQGVGFSNSNPLTGPAAEALDEYLVKNKIKLVHSQVLQVASPCITESDMLKLRDAVIAEIQNGADGVVVTHGTDTLEETSYFLDITVPRTVPLVAIGAMRSINELVSDVTSNFQAGITVACSSLARNMGTLVVLNQEIHAARDVIKTNTTDLATFKSPLAGNLGFLTADGKVIFTRLLPETPFYDIKQMNKKVLLIKTYAGICPLIFEALDAVAEKNDSYPLDGLVLEGMGTGNLNPSLIEPLQKLEKLGIPIVLASRCINGIPEPVYSYKAGLKHLKEESVKSLVLSNGLSGVKARLKLAVLLNNGITDIETEFEKNLLVG